MAPGSCPPTADGYVLQVHRIPRHGARDVAYFQHGVLDTSLGWVSAAGSSTVGCACLARCADTCRQPCIAVPLISATTSPHTHLSYSRRHPASPLVRSPQVSNGVVGSAAFAAYDAGFDVWLGNSRSNAPRLHVGEAAGGGAREGPRYKWADWGLGDDQPGMLLIQTCLPGIRACRCCGCSPRAPLCPGWGHLAKTALTTTHSPADADKQGSRYWRYSINELGVYDIGAGELLPFLAWAGGVVGGCMGWGAGCLRWLAVDASWLARGRETVQDPRESERGACRLRHLVLLPPARQPADFHAHCQPALQPLPHWPAVVAHIHNTKVAELAAPGRHAAASQEAPAQQPRQLRRSSTDSQLGALRWVDVHSGSSRGDLEPASSGVAAPGEAASQGRAAAAGGRQREGSGKEQGEPPWWQRLGGGGGAASQRELAMASVGEGAAPLRRVQSAPEPLFSLGQEAAAQFAVPVRMEQPQQPQHPASTGKRRASSGKRRSSTGGSKLGSSGGGSGRGSGSSSSRASGAAGSSSSGGTSGATGGAPSELLPYRLQAVGHSLGAASLLVYAVVCRMRGQPHHLRRLVLMSPAGFHTHIPTVRAACGLGWLLGCMQGAGSLHRVGPGLHAAGIRAAAPNPAAVAAFGCLLQGVVPCKYLFPPLVWLLDRTPFLRHLGMGMRLPSPLLRYITFKFSMVGSGG